MTKNGIDKVIIKPPNNRVINPTLKYNCDFLLAIYFNPLTFIQNYYINIINIFIFCFCRFFMSVIFCDMFTCHYIVFDVKGIIVVHCSFSFYRFYTLQFSMWTFDKQDGQVVKIFLLFVSHSFPHLGHFNFVLINCLDIFVPPFFHCLF